MELIKKYDDKLIVKKSRIKKKIYEAKLLRLNCQKSKKILNWTSVLNFNQLVDFTSSWYKTFTVNLYLQIVINSLSGK